MSLIFATLAICLLSTGSFSFQFPLSFSSLPRHWRCSARDAASIITSAGFRPSLSSTTFKTRLYVKKRKDNRKYVASPKEDDDEPDDDYFEELAEDVKALLRSSNSLPIRVDASSNTSRG